MSDFLEQYCESDELYHYGRLGQKWGIRLYQNKDGSLTEAGRIRYRKWSTKKTMQKLNQMNELRQRAGSTKKYKKLVDLYGEKGLARIYKDIDAGHSNVGAIGREKNRQRVLNTLSNGITIVKMAFMLTPVNFAIRGGVGYGLEAVSNMLKPGNFSKMKISGEDARNIAREIQKGHLSKRQLKGLVDLNLFDDLGLGTSKIEDVERHTARPRHTGGNN